MDVKSILKAAFKHLLGSGVTLEPAAKALVILSKSGKTAMVDWPAKCNGKTVVLHDLVSLV